MLVTGADGLAREYLAARVPGYAPNANEVAILAVNRGQACGAVAYEGWTGPNIIMTCAGEGNWLTPGNLAGFFWYPFRQLDCQRVTALIHRKNKPSRTLCEKLGFKVEGVLRKAAPTGGDIIIYGLLREDCRWLAATGKTQWVSYGQIYPQSPAAA